MVMPTVRGTRNVIALFGVNGVGKSAVADTLNELIFDSIRVSGSRVLREYFGATREDLEKIAPEVKMSIKVPALIEEFNRAKRCKFILLDMHLIVAVRKEGALIYEDVWSDAFLPYILKAYFIYAEPQLILDRRKAGLKETGRKRNMSVQNIKRVQEMNLIRFQEIFKGKGIGKVLNSTDQHFVEVANRIAGDLQIE